MKYFQIVFVLCTFFQYILNYQPFIFQVEFKVILKFWSGLKDLYKLFWEEFISLFSQYINIH